MSIAVAMSIVFFAVPPVHAGCCKTLNACLTDQDLGAPDKNPNSACIEQGGTYDTGCGCLKSAPQGTGSSSTKPKGCCIYAAGSCLPENDAHLCSEISSLPYPPEHDARACKDIPKCTNPSTTGSSTSAATKIISFKPNITLPGSKFVAGQAIEVTGATLGEYIAALYAFIVGSIGILAAVMIFYGGIKWMMAAGNSSQVQEAKDTIKAAVLGVVLAMSAYLILLTISPKLVKFSSLQLQPVAGIAQSLSGLEQAEGSKGAPAGTKNLSSLDAAWYNDMKAKYGAIITQTASATNVPETLIYGIIFIESGGNPSLISSLGACGLLQVKPSTAANLIPGVPAPTCDDLLQPNIGLQAGIYYLKKLFAVTCPTSTKLTSNNQVISCNPAATKCGSTDPRVDPTYVIAAYNGGPGANCDSRSCKYCQNGGSQGSLCKQDSDCSGGQCVSAGLTFWECPENEKPGGGYTETRAYVQNVQAAIAKIRTF